VKGADPTNTSKVPAAEPATSGSTFDNTLLDGGFWKVVEDSTTSAINDPEADADPKPQHTAHLISCKIVGTS